MALTVGDLEKNTIPVVGGAAGYEMVLKTIAFDSSYATGGESLTAADLGLAAAVLVVANASAGYVFEYDYTNSKLKAYRGDNTNAAAAPLIEVANAVDLSAVTGIRLLAFGTPA